MPISWPIWAPGLGLPQLTILKDGVSMPGDRRIAKELQLEADGTVVSQHQQRSIDEKP